MHPPRLRGESYDDTEIVFDVTDGIPGAAAILASIAFRQRLRHDPILAQFFYQILTAYALWSERLGRHP